MEKLSACIVTPDHPPRALQRLGRVDRTELTDSETEPTKCKGCAQGYGAHKCKLGSYPGIQIRTPASAVRGDQGAAENRA